MSRLEKPPSKERGCDGKIRLGRSSKNQMRQADRMSKKHGKPYGVYSCPHCGDAHLTSKIENGARYVGLLYISYPAPPNSSSPVSPPPTAPR